MQERSVAKSSTDELGFSDGPHDFYKMEMDQAEVEKIDRDYKHMVGDIDPEEADEGKSYNSDEIEAQFEKAMDMLRHHSHSQNLEQYDIPVQNAENSGLKLEEYLDGDKSTRSKYVPQLHGKSERRLKALGAGERNLSGHDLDYMHRSRREDPHDIDYHSSLRLVDPVELKHQRE